MFNLRSFYVFSLLIILNFTLYAQKKVACIGDSVTKGYGIKDSTSSYPSVLQTLLGEEYIVRNYGHSGATLLNSGHNPYIKTKAYQDAIQFRPDIIIVALGLNDTDPRNWPNYQNDFLADYTSLIEDFKKINPSVEVFVCKMTPIFSGHRRFLSGTRDWFQQIQNLIPAIAKANNATLIDNYSILSSRIDLFDDYLHPEEKGAALIAHNVFKYLKPIKQQLHVDETMGSHMVLQRNVINLLKGKSSANALVEVFFNGKILETHANHLGEWKIELPKQKAGGPFEIAVQSGNEKIILKDVLFGDVFLASGQSNMAFPLKSALGSDSLLKIANGLSQVRVFKNNVLAETANYAWTKDVLDKVNDLEYFTGEWQVGNAESVKDFSAIAFTAAFELAISQHIPIGIIDLSVGGSNTESWISRATLENDNLLATYIHNWKSSDFIQDFCRDRGAKNTELSTRKNQRHPYDPAYNYEAGIAKWKDTQLKSVLWYQGESNAHNIEHHAYLFKTLVADWRNTFRQELPFYMVQLSSINRPSWGAFRDSQRKLSNELKDVHLVISYDKGDKNDVHPRDKITIGKRLANSIRQHDYKAKIEAESPQLTHLSTVNNKIILSFNNCKYLKLSKGASLLGLAIMNEKGQILTINNAKINKNKIQFSTTEKIRSIQFAYEAFTDANVISDSNVPVSTFKVDLDK